MGKFFICCQIQLKFRLRVRLKPSNDRGEFEFDRARSKNGIAENSYALGHETHNRMILNLHCHAGAVNAHLPAVTAKLTKVSNKWMKMPKFKPIVVQLGCSGCNKVIRIAAYLLQFLESRC